MKKAIFALALFAASAVSMAQNVTIYGVVDAAVQKQTGKGVELKSGAPGSQSGSRLGFKGTEDLGGGNKAVFVLENGFSVDTGGLATNNVLFNRQAFVGLSNDKLGLVKLGRQYTPVYDLLNSTDPFGTGLAGDVQRMIKYTARTDNTVLYATPTYNGVNAQVAYSFAEGTHRQLGLGASYTFGPLYVIAARNDVEGPNALSNTGIAATYQHAFAKSHAAIVTEKGAGNVDAVNTMIGASKKVGTGTVLVSYINKNDQSAKDADAQQYAIGYTYPMSARTNLYTSAAFTNNEVGSNVNLINAGVRVKF